MKSNKNNMLGKALEILIVETMTNHVYTFGNEIRIQSKGGPIGLSLTEELADCWCERMFQPPYLVIRNVKTMSHFLKVTPLIWAFEGQNKESNK